MARHARAVDERLRTVRLCVVAAVWACGLAAGFYGLLAAAAKYGCGDADDGFACHTSGSVVGLVIVAAVIAIVTAVTMLTLDRPARGVVVLGGIGITALVVCLVVARSLLATA